MIWNFGDADAGIAAPSAKKAASNVPAARRVKTICEMEMPLRPGWLIQARAPKNVKPEKLFRRAEQLQVLPVLHRLELRASINALSRETDRTLHAVRAQAPSAWLCPTAFRLNTP
jgi:hypothetical protein